MLTGHTKEPWVVERAHDIDAIAWVGQFAVLPADHATKVTRGNTEDDACRIVACVNACAGIPTEALALSYQFQVDAKMSEIEAHIKTAQQRDQLLEALEAVIKWYDMEADHSIEPDFYKRMAACQVSEEMAREAIAAARGER